ncbi:MAG: UvrD-helicase domain-containing protein [Parcubacteria group bacterium]|nr:UvrD-helicase domain-containing protein [Parcubacteria group bacterium]
MHLKGLNSQQKEAVLHKDGPLLIIAGAGAGKTKTITHRILNLIKTGERPESILAVTFTNKAAKEMKERVKDLLDKDKEINFPIHTNAYPYVATFHALGVKILKENARVLNTIRHFKIFDRNDSNRAIKDALKKFDYDPKQYPPKKILSIISKQKGDAVSLKMYEENVGNSYFPKIVAQVWREYEEILKKEKAFDFDDLLLKTVNLLEQNQNILERYQKNWKYIHIDEYQDTNKVQYKLANLLACKHSNVCVVGDVDQNIYSWRGADIQNMLDFEKQYKQVKTLLLEENYRSTKTILEASNRIIKKNKNRKEKTLFTNNKDGENISLFSAYNEMQEAQFVALKSKELIEEGIAPKDIAVLYRANFQSRILEEVFLALDIPYQVLGVRFFERKEVKDILAFLSAALNEDSISDMKRIINVPARGIGKVTLLKIVEGRENELSPKMQEKVKNFKLLLEKIKEVAETKKPSETIKFILKESGIEAMLKTKNEEDLERLENIKELVTLAMRYDKLTPEEGIGKLLEDAALQSDQDELKEEKNAVRLMTVHASKGLEFGTVFITGLEDGLFPHTSMSDEKRDDEEERRLFYVALTRAKKKVFLTYASVRTIFGSQTVNLPSDFIIDIEDDLIDEVTLDGEASEQSITKEYLIDFD